MATALTDPNSLGGLIIGDIAPFEYTEHDPNTVSSATIAKYMLEMPVLHVRERRHIANELQSVLPSVSKEVINFLMTNYVPDLEKQQKDWWKWRCSNLFFFSLLF